MRFCGRGIRHQAFQRDIKLAQDQDVPLQPENHPTSEHTPIFDGENCDISQAANANESTVSKVGSANSESVESEVELNERKEDYEYTLSEDGEEDKGGGDSYTQQDDDASEGEMEELGAKNGKDDEGSDADFTASEEYAPF